jgi:hypothetical protein
MTRSLSVFALVAVLAIAPATADASPAAGARPVGCNNCGGEKSAAGSLAMDRSTFLAVGAPVSIAFIAGDTFALVRNGKPNTTLAGIGFIAAFPVALWGIDMVSQNSGDKASWAVTVAATGMVAYGLWPLVDRFVLGHADDDESPIPKARAFHAGPTVVVGPNDAAGAGLGFSGRF